VAQVTQGTSGAKDSSLGLNTEKGGEDLDFSAGGGKKNFDGGFRVRNREKERESAPGNVSKGKRSVVLA